MGKILVIESILPESKRKDLKQSIESQLSNANENVTVIVVPQNSNIRIMET